MTRQSLSSTLGAALMACAAHNSAYAAESRVEVEGVSISAGVSAGKAVFCFRPKKGWKMSAQYGVEFQIPPSEGRYWNEPSPKLVSEEKPYFDAPLRIELRRRGPARPVTLNLVFGACNEAAGCVPFATRVTIPAFDPAQTFADSCAD